MEIMEITSPESILRFCLNLNTQNIIHKTVYEHSKFESVLINLLNPNAEIHIHDKDSESFATSQYPKDPEKEVLGNLVDFF